MTLAVYTEVVRSSYGDLTYEVAWELSINGVREGDSIVSDWCGRSIESSVRIRHRRTFCVKGKGTLKLALVGRVRHVQVVEHLQLPIFVPLLRLHLCPVGGASRVEKIDVERVNKLFVLLKLPRIKDLSISEGSEYYPEPYRTEEVVMRHCQSN